MTKIGKITNRLLKYVFIQKRKIYFSNMLMIFLLNEEFFSMFMYKLALNVKETGIVTKTV